MPVAPRVYEDPDEGRDRLAELGLLPGDLPAGLRFGYLARLSCNANDPPLSVGTMFWGRMTRGLREQLAPRGWRKTDTPLSVVRNADETLDIVVCSGTNQTGVADGHPKSRFPKGRATRAAVAANAGTEGAQPELFSDEEPATRRPTLWMLLVNVVPMDDKTLVRAELSLPYELDEEGRVSGWLERIILPPLEDTDNRRARQGDADLGPDFDVDVQRRAG